MMNRILFVGEDQPLWQEFRSEYGRPGGAWIPEFAHNRAESLACLERKGFAAVVADARLADTTGVGLLDEVMRLYPDALRVVLSDLNDTRSSVQCLGRGHHHLFKPCDVSTLVNALDQARQRERWLPTETVRGLISKMRYVPSPPTVYLEVVMEMQAPEVSAQTVGELIAKDPAITAKVLQLANSAVFGLRLQVIHPVEAVTYLGLEMTRTLVLLAHTFSAFDPKRLAGFSVNLLWSHSLSVGQFARRIAQLQDGSPELTEQAFSAGLLHDLGKLLFAANLPASFAQAVNLAWREQRPLWSAEVATLGVSHAELGACLLGIWGLPDPIVKAVALHHCPQHSNDPAFSPLLAVHAANCLAHELTPGQSTAPAGVDLVCLQSLGLDQQWELWRQACLEEGQPVDNLHA